MSLHNDPRWKHAYDFEGSDAKIELMSLIGEVAAGEKRAVKLFSLAHVIPLEGEINHYNNTSFGVDGAYCDPETIEKLLKIRVYTPVDLETP